MISEVFPKCAVCKHLVLSPHGYEWCEMKKHRDGTPWSCVVMREHLDLCGPDANKFEPKEQAQ